MPIKPTEMAEGIRVGFHGNTKQQKQGQGNIKDLTQTEFFHAVKYQISVQHRNHIPKVTAADKIKIAQYQKANIGNGIQQIICHPCRKRSQHNLLDNSIGQINKQRHGKKLQISFEPS